MPTGKAIPPPTISDSQYQSKAQAMAAAAKPPLPTTTNGTSTFVPTQPLNNLPQPPSSPPLPPPPENAAHTLEENYAVTEL